MNKLWVAGSICLCIGSSMSKGSSNKNNCSKSCCCSCNKSCSQKQPFDKKEELKEVYGGLAKNTAQSGEFGGKTCSCRAKVSQDIGYTKEEIAGLAQANMGLGCGYPIGLGDIQEGSTVVDLGSGAGLDCFLASHKVGPKGKVIGIDMSEDMVRKARENATKYEAHNVEFLLGDIEHMPLKDGIADIIISNCVLSLAESKDRAFAEAYRVLKPGGKMYVSDIVLLGEFTSAQRSDPKLKGTCALGAILKSEYLEKVKAAGFDIELVGEDVTINETKYGNKDLPLSSLKYRAIKPLVEFNTQKNIIKEAYAHVAQVGELKTIGGGCCGGGACLSTHVGYSEEETETFPEANLGLGCGHPINLGTIQKGDVVLDLGSGAGFDAFLAARKVGPAGKVFGVDMTEDMIKKARENAHKYGFSNVVFKQGDIENLPIENASIDVVISNCVINLVQNKKRVFEEVYRVLKPGGKIAISDVVLLGALAEEQKNNRELLCACVSGAILKDEYIKILSDLGFDVKVIEEDTEISQKWFGSDEYPIESMGFVATKTR